MYGEADEGEANILAVWKEKKQNGLLLLLF